MSRQSRQTAVGRKNDPALPPTDASAIQAVTPSDVFNWQGPTEPLKASLERIAAEQKWYALTGRVIELRAEEDGDLHIALADATGDKPGIVVAEIPAKPTEALTMRLSLPSTPTMMENLKLRFSNYHPVGKIQAINR